MSVVVGDDLLLVMRRIDALLGEPAMPTLADDTMLAALQRIEDLLSGMGGGSVTSVGLQGDGTIIDTVVNNSPITGAGTMTLKRTAVAKNRVLAGPLAGFTLPTWRLLDPADLPAPNVVTRTGDYTVDNNAASGGIDLCDTHLVPSELTITLCAANAVAAGWDRTWIVTDATHPLTMAAVGGDMLVVGGLLVASTGLVNLGQVLTLVSDGSTLWYVRDAYAASH